jgi:hypothetical protein
MTEKSNGSDMDALKKIESKKGNTIQFKVEERE